MSRKTNQSDVQDVDVLASRSRSTRRHSHRILNFTSTRFFLPVFKPSKTTNKLRDLQYSLKSRPDGTSVSRKTG